MDKHVLVIKFAQPKKNTVAAAVPKSKGPNAIQKKKAGQKQLVVTKSANGGKVLLSERFAKRRVRIV